MSMRIIVMTVMTTILTAIVMCLEPALSDMRMRYATLRAEITADRTAELPTGGYLAYQNSPAIFSEVWCAEENSQIILIEKNPNGLFINGRRVALYQMPDRDGDYRVTGQEVEAEIANKSVISARVADFLLKHQEFIPDEWKGQDSDILWQDGRHIYFFGTRFATPDGILHIRSIYWDAKKGEFRPSIFQVNANRSWRDTTVAVLQ